MAGNFILLNVFLAIAVDNLSTGDEEEEGAGGGEGEGGGEGGEEKGGQPEAEVINDPPPLYMEVFIITNIHPNSKSQEESWP